MTDPEAPASPRAAGRSLRDLGPVPLVRSAHPRLAVATAVGLAAVAALSGRPAREVGLVLVTVLAGQAVLGWDNDLLDEEDDRAAGRLAKPLVSGRLERGTVWFALACAVLLVVPLALSNGFEAGAAYLASLLVGVVGNRILRTGPLSWLPWAVGYALYPAFLSYGGWGGGRHGGAPTVTVTVLAAFLGVGVHVLTSLRGLVEDNRAGRRGLPLRLGLRLGAPRLLLLSGLYCAALLVALASLAATAGLTS
jgi:4-hydroxybenzoate polyprenyltransferase